MAEKKTIIIAIGVVVALVAIGIITLVLSNGNGSSDSSTPSPIFGPIDLPKAPFWDVNEQCMYFVDVYLSGVHKYVPSTNTHTFATVGSEPMAFIIPLEGTSNKFIISYGANLSIITWDGTSTQPTIETWTPIGPNVYRANEGKVSPSGSLFVGTHSPFKSNNNIQMNNASLYIFQRDKKSKIAIENVTVGNGMAWSRDNSTFYFIDSLAYTVQAFAYDMKTDALSNGKVLIDFQKANISGVPDGMAIDNEDKLWITSFNGHQVIRLNPETGSIMQKIHLDALQVTSAVFAGIDLNDFYLTTGRYKMNATMISKYPHSGYIYKQKNFGIKGRPGVPFKPL